MSSSNFTINGVECRAIDDEIDLRAAGFLKTSIPPEILNHPQIKTILLYHEDAPEFLESIVDNVGSQVSINVFVDYDNKSCEIKTDELGLISLDVRCNAVNVVGVIAACKWKLRSLVLRNYECGSLDGLDRTTVSDVEELVIASDDMLSVNVDIFHYYFYGFNGEEIFPEISFQNITLKTSYDRITDLDTSSQCNTISLEGMTKLQGFLLCANGKNILPTGMDQLNHLQELFIFDNPIGDDFELSDTVKLRKVILFNCGLKVLPLAITAMEELEVLELYHNNFHNQLLSLDKLVKLKRLFIFNCFLNTYPVSLEKLTNLEHLNLGDNGELGEQSFSIPSLRNLKRLDMRHCGLKKLPDNLENYIGLINCDMSFNKLKQFPECFANLIESGTNFEFEGNVLEKPPQVICNDGRSILNYFKSIAKFGEAHSKRLRVLVIGNSGAGKTSLVNGLLMGEPGPTKEDERTEGIEIRKWYPDPENEDLELEIWDFGGHMEYQSVSHYFFERHSLFLLAVDVSKYETTDESYDENAGKWIDELKSIVRRPVIMVAATKSDLVKEDSVVNDRCKHMLEKINKQEKLDVDSIKSDLEKLDENDNSNTCRKEKLYSLTAVRPVLPKEIVLTSHKEEASSNEEEVSSDEEEVSLDEEQVSPDEEKVSSDKEIVSSDEEKEILLTSDEKKERSSAGETCIVVTSAGVWLEIASLKVNNLSQELVRTGNNTDLFPHLNTTLPLLWVEIEKLLPTLRKKINLTNYLTYDELVKWLSQNLEKFNEAVDKKETLNAILLYLVKLGKILHFKHVEHLRDLIFPDPQRIIMLVKEVVHHNVESHLKFREEFKACNVDAEMFINEKRDLVKQGMLSESLLRCIWFDAVPKLPDFKKLAPLLYHFDVGYKMSVEEAEIEGKEISKNYTFIPALMPEDPPVGITNLWPTTALENEIEISTQYSIYSTLPVGLFERQMVRSHRCSNYRIHWNKGFFGITTEEREKVTFNVTKESNKIEFTGRMSNSGKINGLWMVVLRFHQIFADMVEELWPRLRYKIRNRCPGCRKYHHNMDFKILMKASKDDNKEFFCEDPYVMDFVKKELIIPPPEVVKKFQEINGASTTSAGVSSPVMVSDIPYLVIQDICRLLNVESAVGGDYRTLAGMLGMKTTDIWLLSQNANPTDEVLKWWVPQNSATVQKFQAILKDMRRGDVLAVLDAKKQSEYQTDEEIQPPQKKSKLDDNPDQG